MIAPNYFKITDTFGITCILSLKSAIFCPFVLSNNLEAIFLTFREIRQQQLVHVHYNNSEFVERYLKNRMIGCIYNFVGAILNWSSIVHCSIKLSFGDLLEGINVKLQ